MGWSSNLDSFQVKINLAFMITIKLFIIFQNIWDSDWEQHFSVSFEIIFNRFLI